MIDRVTVGGFKRFREATVELPHHVVLAGLNNSGKTTLLQAIAAWNLCLRRWRELGDFNPRKGYAMRPVSRPDFTAVPLRSLELLWHGARYAGPAYVDVVGTAGWRVRMELVGDTSEQLKVHPSHDTRPEDLQRDPPQVVYVPPMTGLQTAEPVYQAPYVDLKLAEARPGEVLRNILVEASRSERAWEALCESVQRLFGCHLQPPDARGAHIVAEYTERPAGPRLDVASGGSGFQQVLMLLAFLHARPASVLLLDEPDAHLHVFLQNAIASELRRVAAANRAQLVMATHSEQVIDSVDPRELVLVSDTPRPLADTAERSRLIRSLGALTNTDAMQATEARGILYVEGPTDLEILRAWAAVLDHRARALLGPQLFWHPQVREDGRGVEGVRAREHHECLALVRPDLPGLWLRDRDDVSEAPDTPITGQGFQQARWRRYEIESYLFHPEAVARFCAEQVGGGAAGDVHRVAVLEWFENTQPPAFLADPLGDHPFLVGTKARTHLLPPALTAGGLPGFPYTRFHEIASLMLQDEVHPEVVEKLDALCRAFNA